MDPFAIFWIGIGIGFTIAALIAMAVNGAAYRNGVCDGYGYGQEPGNPGYREAGQYLRRHMAHRWPELEDDTHDYGDC